MPARSLRALRGRLLVVASFLLAHSFATASADSEPDATVTNRIVVFTGGAFGGDAVMTYNGAFSFSFDEGLEPTPIAGFRFEAAFLHYLALGGQLRTSFWHVDPADRRNTLFDLSMTPRVRFPIVIDTRFLVEPYLVVPVGLSVGLWNSSVDVGYGFDRANPGLNLGMLLGTTFLTRSHVGAMVEFGWMHHVIYDKDRDGQRGTLILNQATLHAGIVYAY